MRIRPVFAWYDLWVGAYWDRRCRKLYVLPLPCIGFWVEFNVSIHARRTGDRHARAEDRAIQGKETMIAAPHPKGAHPCR